MTTLRIPLSLFALALAAGTTACATEDPPQAPGTVEHVTAAELDRGTMPDEVQATLADPTVLELARCTIEYGPGDQKCIECYWDLVGDRHGCIGCNVGGSWTCY